MGATQAGRRVAYDRTWGILLLASCLIPATLTAEGALEQQFWVPGDPRLSAWLLVGTAAGAIALVLGLGGFRGRWRHFINITLGCAVLAMPLFIPRIWDTIPQANPARLPIADVGRIGWVMLLALGAMYIGCGIRVTRPTHFTGLALGTAGALIMTLFACIPASVGGSGYASEKVLLFRDFADNWGELLPTALVAASLVCALANMVRNKFEVRLAKLSRILLVSALVVVILLPFLSRDDGALSVHAPAAFGAVRFFGPLFLAIDGAIAFTAISITRGQE
jgi:hypothetical protein